MALIEPQQYDWHQQHQYCAHSGRKEQKKKGTYESPFLSIRSQESCPVVLASGGGVTGGHLGQGECHGAVDEQDDNQTVEDGHWPAMAEPEDQG